jgi:putative protease
MPPRRPEILAPAGDLDAMRAAVEAGADAVYFGLHGFNARARATNFDEAALRETLCYLHERGAKGYVTLNTLVFDDELPRVEAAVRLCADAAVDAVIVQDLGVAKLVRAVAPSLPVHASTQMTCTDAASVQLARSLGAARVILARELSLGDIAAIRAETDAELEVFVHGALCIAYSGQCLTSEAIGGRSANRGACAQACRLPYELVVDGVKRELGDRAYLLSPEDLETSALVPELVALGVASLKIEGRLKGPEYVAATTRLYRHAIDAALEGASSRRGPTEEERRAALQMFSRGSGPGFLGGVDHQRLVDGRTCDHHGLLAGESRGMRSVRGKRLVAVVAQDVIARGDGILVEGGFAGEGELGGRVWNVIVEGDDVERANAGELALLWLGPDRKLEEEVPTGRRVWKTNDPAREREVRAFLSSNRDEKREKRALLAMRITSPRIGEPAILEARAPSGATARVTLDAPVESARSAPTDEAVLRDKLGRLGDTPFGLGELTVELPEGAMIPLSSLNRARRALVEALLAAPAPPGSHAVTTLHASDLLAAAIPPDRTPPPPGVLFVLCRSMDQASAALDAGADGVYLDFLELTGTGAAVRTLRSRPGGAYVAVAPPRIRKPGEEKIDRYLASLAPDAILVRGLGALFEPLTEPLHEAGHEAAAAGRPPLRVGDFSLNVTNAITAAEILGRGLHAFTPSFDLDATQLAALLTPAWAPYAEVVVHHPMPLFHMEHCVIAALLSSGHDHRTCGRPCDRHKVSLRDRAGLDHPVEADVGCRNTVFHASAQSAAHVILGVRERGVRRFRIELVRESAEDVSRLVGAYRRLLEGRSTPSEAWRELKTLRTEAGYGVVKGSLRVLT